MRGPLPHIAAAAVGALTLGFAFAGEARADERQPPNWGQCRSIFPATERMADCVEMVTQPCRGLERTINGWRGYLECLRPRVSAWAEFHDVVGAALWDMEVPEGSPLARKRWQHERDASCRDGARYQRSVMSYGPTQAEISALACELSHAVHATLILADVLEVKRGGLPPQPRTEVAKDREDPR